jgi:23S rRNA (uracil1939-C5)-methyltransferase
MHEARTHDPVQVDLCVILDPALEQARRTLASFFAGSRGRGEVQLALGRPGVPDASGARGDGRLPVLHVRWTGELAREFFARLEGAVASGALGGAQVALDDANRPARIGDPTPWMTGADDRPLRLAAGGFGQASEAMNATLARHVAGLVRGLAGNGTPPKAVELFAGAGNLGVVLANEVSELVCVESNREACEAARFNLAARTLANARVTEGDADAYAWAPGTKLVVLDPPRTGARAVAERLASSRVEHVVYVSCDTQTLGRDLAILQGSYEPLSIATFEMFPQTSHVEAVVALVARGRSR